MGKGVTAKPWFLSRGGVWQHVWDEWGFMALSGEWGSKAKYHPCVFKYHEDVYPK